MVLVGCSSEGKLDDRAVIEAIADDLGEGVRTGDLMKIDKHMTLQAKRQGFEGNRFLMECSYGAAVMPELKARTVKVMGDTAHLAFAVMPTGMPYNDSLPRSIVRLVKVGTWKIASFHISRITGFQDSDSLSESETDSVMDQSP
jgi:hypothetical protein